MNKNVIKKPSSKTFNILIVEDNPSNALLLTDILGLNGFSFFHVESGEDALFEMNNNHFDCILMDIQLPGISGVETLKKFRQKNITTPCIAVTASSQKNQESHLKKTGFQHIISKPIKMSNVLESLHHYCNLQLK